MPPRNVPSSAATRPHALTPEDFDDIREAVMETSRGRWFLDEFAARLRSAETARLADGLHRIEKTVSANHDRLMARLSEALRHEPPAGQPAAPQPDIAPRHMKYYRADEDIFEPAPHARIAAVPDLPRFSELAAAEGLEVPPPEAPAKRRIVIIRHKPGEQIDVPLADEIAKAS